MFSASQLTEEQKEAIHSWVAEGAQMSDVQKRLKEEFEISLTYMDTRFLSLDLDLQFISEEEEQPESAPLVAEEPEEKPLNELTEDDLEFKEPPPGGFRPVTVTLDTVARPGAMVSGKMSFSDGEQGTWLIDEMGRPSIDPDTPGYRPSQGDLMEFQDRLRELLEGHA